ncbi:zinc-dependent metalloprotease [Yunchengibacter salinarum]|uniref:zinc-dependent metalloprotease n=1 Tax=Yunchengibacter salinarum TaxID=3133399 RepID=UPI0035B68581
MKGDHGQTMTATGPEHSAVRSVAERETALDGGTGMRAPRRPLGPVAWLTVGALLLASLYLAPMALIMTPPATAVDAPPPTVKAVTDGGNDPSGAARLDSPDTPDPESPENPDGDTADESAAEKPEASDDGAPGADDEGGTEQPVKDAIALATEDYETIPGLFTLYRHPRTGKLLMEVRADQLNEEFIYFSHVMNGVSGGSRFRGEYRREKILAFRKVYDRLQLVAHNTNHYFDPESALSRAKDANINDSILLAERIIGQTADGERFLIKANNLFASEDLERLKENRGFGFGYKLGKLSQSRTSIVSVDNYPGNTGVLVDYVFSDNAPEQQGSFAITDPRNVTVSVRHTLVPVPDNDFQPRMDDPRVGYFLSYMNDMTAVDATPWRDMIHRWHLVKKDPDAALSPPTEPIVWWIENTTPKPLRPIIRKAVLAWNKAFEAAGFRDVIEVRQQPDDAEWDAGDIRYNVIRWASSPNPAFAGYGPSFVNPRTGQILGADIMLEYSFLRGSLLEAKIFNGAALSLPGADARATPLPPVDRQWDVPALDPANRAANARSREQREGRPQPRGWHLASEGARCSAAGAMQFNTMLGTALSQVFDRAPEQRRRLIEEAVYFLVMHEMGHTLGLSHNMMATQARDYDSAHGKAGDQPALIGSVMDYPAVNFAPEGRDQGRFFATAPGPYDRWAIAFGYDPALSDGSERADHLARSTEKGLAFGNDADDMRVPGKGIDPRINVFDFSDDAIRYAADRLTLARKALNRMADRFTKPGESHQAVRNAYLFVTADMLWQARVVSRYVGGIYTDRAVVGQKGADAPYRPVPVAQQKRAMDLLADHIFAPDAFQIPAELARRLAPQRRGLFTYATNEDPKIHARTVAIQADILAHLLHPLTLMRMTDTRLYGNDYSVTAMMTRLTDALFRADRRGDVNSFRQEIQVYYVEKLASLVDDSRYDYVARSNAIARLKDIRRTLDRWRGGDETRAHREHLIMLIERAFEKPRQQNLIISR